MRTYVTLPVLALVVAGCTTPRLPERPSLFSQEELQRAKTPPVVDAKPAGELGLDARMPEPAVATPVAARKLYTFRARGLPVELAMAQFAQVYGINVSIDRDVRGQVTADFRNLPLDKALEALLEVNGLSWEWDDGLLRVTRLQTKTFNVDYLRLTRTGNSTTTTSSTSTGGGGGGDTTRAGLSKSDTINFWSELESQLEDILTKGRADSTDEQAAPMETVTTLDRVANTTTTSIKPLKEKEGRLIINRLSGTVQVTSTRTRMRAVEDYLKQLHENIGRQVFIDVRIVEVGLNSDRSLGIDWNQINFGALKVGSATNFTTSAAGSNVPPLTAAALYSKVFPKSFLVNDMDVVIRALQQQGDVKVVSQPRIRTLNNQSAIVRSGTERTFFTTQTVLTPVAGGTPVISTTTTPTTITEGLVLSLTPQISVNGRIAMDVSPVITRISGVDVSPDGKSNAPRLDVKQTSTMVRVGDGETVIIGGLIQEVEEETNRAVPGLGDVPGVRNLFGTTYKSVSRRELVVILTPYIVQ